MKKFLCLIVIFLLVLSFFNLTWVKAAPASHAVLSEIQITGGTGYTTDEFVEIYNPTEADINLSGWKLIKKTSSGKEYSLVDDFGDKIIKSHSFFLMAHPAGYSGQTQPDFYYTTTNSIAENNTVILYDNAGQVVDKVGFGTTIDFEGGTLSNPSAKKSVERKAKSDSTEETMVEGGADYFLGNAEDTDNNAQDFILRSTPEPQNSQSELEYLTIQVPEIPQPPKTEEPKTEEPKNNEPGTEEPKNEETIVYSDKIIISEFFPNPEGSDDQEFIELKNIGQENVDLAGWKIGDNSSRKFIIESEDFNSTIINMSGFFVIDKEKSKISLNNTGDSVKLYQPNDNLLNKVDYSECYEGQSYNLINKNWAWSDNITPGKENILKIKNEPPVAEMDLPDEAKVRETITFDASESSDPDADELEYFWDFGDGQSAKGEEAEHLYQKAGDYTVNFKVVDEKGAEDKLEGKIKITDYDYSDKIMINELMPAPDGPDKDLEWAELFNPENRDINLEGWQLTDLKMYYKFPENKIIKAESYLIIKRQDSKISLNDSGDKLFLIDPAKKIINGVEYQKAKKDLAFARHEGAIHWAWTEKPTLGGKNEFILGEDETNVTTEGTENAENTEIKEQAVNTTPVALKISDVNESYLKKLVTVGGEVERTSGQNIYLTDAEGNGLRVYIQKKTGIKKPEIKQGDSLTVTGILDKTEAGLRLLPRRQEDIVMATQKEVGQVLGVETEKNATAEPINNQSQPVKTYLLVTAIALAIILAGLLLRNYFVKRKSS